MSRAAADPAANRLLALQDRVMRCRACPRLRDYLAQIRGAHPDWWCRPVPSFGDAAARIVIIGLAPGRAGSNRTGRMFTGDASGRFLYPVLHRVGLVNQPTAERADDGLRLAGAYITAVARCAPPQNKPAGEEVGRCSRFVGEELQALPRARVIVTLGKIAHDATLRLLGHRPSACPFRHGAEYRLAREAAPDPRAWWLLASYHPSQQNTQTGRLSAAMFEAVFARAVELARASA